MIMHRRGRRERREDFYSLCVLRVLCGENATVERTEEFRLNLQSEEKRYTALTHDIIGAAITVHRALGPGLLESAYEACLAFELMDAGHHVERQKPLPVVYRDVVVECGYRLDMLVDELVVIELKAVERLLAIHEAQLISYLKLSGMKLGLLMNFNVKYLHTGVRRFANGLPSLEGRKTVSMPADPGAISLPRK